MIEKICEWSGQPIELCDGQCCWPWLPGGYLIEPFDLSAFIEMAEAAPVEKLSTRGDHHARECYYLDIWFGRSERM